MTEREATVEQDEARRQLILQRVLREGWTDHVVGAFERAYGADIRRLVVLNLWRMGLSESRFDPAHADALLSSRRLQLYENTLSDLWVAMLRGLIAEYVRGVAEGKVTQVFLAYISGVIKHLLIANAQKLGLLPREGLCEILRAYCTSRKAKTRDGHLARLKYRFCDRVREALLSECSDEEFNEVYRNAHHVVDYTFEVVLPEKCEAITSRCTKRILDDVLADVKKRRLIDAVTYTGRVVPYPHGEHEVRPSLEESDDAFLARLGS